MEKRAIQRNSILFRIVNPFCTHYRIDLGQLSIADLVIDKNKIAWQFNKYEGTALKDPGYCASTSRDHC